MLLYSAQSIEAQASNVQEISESDSIQIDSLVFGNITLEADPLITPRIRRHWQQISGAKVDKEVYDYFVTPVLEAYRDHGYPKVSAQLAQSSIKGHRLDGELSIDKGPLVLWDTLHLRGNPAIYHKLLYRTLYIHPNTPYSEKAFRSIARNLQKSKTFTLTHEPQLIMEDDRMVLKMGIKAIKKNNIDVLIGLSPQEVNGRTQYRFTGEVNYLAQNILGRGESLSVMIKRMAKNNQRLRIQVAYPYLFDFPYTVNGGFHLYNSTLDFLNVDASLGLSSALNNGWNVGASFVRQSSRLVTIDSAGLLQSGRLPKSLDLNKTGVAVDIEFEQEFTKILEDFHVRLYGDIGRKNIVRNNEIIGLKDIDADFSTAYDTLNLVSTNVRAEILADLSIPIYDPILGYARIDGGLVYDTQQLNTNEYSRLGGYGRLRGFLEERLLAERYTILTMALRLRLGVESYISLPFIEYGIFKDDQQIVRETFGAGLALAFQTKAGILNVAFANGRFIDAPFVFNDTKVHFGYKVQF